MRQLNQYSMYHAYGKTGDSFGDTLTKLVKEYGQSSIQAEMSYDFKRVLEWSILLIGSKSY